MMLVPTVLLASASPRRRELLGQLGIRFEVAAADVDESALEGEKTEAYVTRVARDKALAGWARSGGTIPALGADTVVLLQGRMLGKPVSRAEAEAMLQSLSGQTHQVYSAVALALGPGQVLEALNVTAVTFGVIPPDWIRRYCRGDEPMDKAGAYAVQGGTGQFIRRIEGSYSGVMGLPLYETAELLRAAGLLQ